MSWLELKVPPPVVAVLFAAAMWLAARLGEPFPLSFGLRVGAAVALAAIALSISFAGLASFRRARTTINPTNPGAASALVCTGVYRFTRNPMYLGLLLCLLAWAVFLTSAPALLFLPAFVLFLNRFQIQPEERALASLFGSEYAEYKNRVRRWL